MIQKDERCLPPKDLHAGRLFGHPVILMSKKYIFAKKTTGYESGRKGNKRKGNKRKGNKRKNERIEKEI